ncbi:dienelactone hydrolase endo-1,3,1,4-beta-D-glucanase [Gymnopilus junonius]|uniref:Dienelactone hydrolase endo-1,3,1,4-beta-D-glucanase n=1 Tax=Gymnopilus junonius TaxID=109634 RepID=A0A9P5NR77_GYMJU|nr:dienelactone hydrolase endo-1,3,1,4-beta-D-glucanase [Gymnopilus junonius]
MSLCEHCIKGVIHEGTPKGKLEKIGGVDSYIATPTGDYPRTRTDSFAENGYKTIVPDYLNDDAIPVDALNPGSTFDLQAWVAKHGAENTRPPLDKVIAALKEEGVTTFGATGYCFGASVVAHPSLLKVPEDLEKYLATSKAPLLINSCEVDTQYPPEAQKAGDEILSKFEIGYKGTTMMDARMASLFIKEGKEGAFKESIEWFKARL